MRAYAALFSWGRPGRHGDGEDGTWMEPGLARWEAGGHASLCLRQRERGDACSARQVAP